MRRPNTLHNRTSASPNPTGDFHQQETTAPSAIVAATPGGNSAVAEHQTTAAATSTTMPIGGTVATSSNIININNNNTSNTSTTSTTQKSPPQRRLKIINNSSSSSRNTSGGGSSGNVTKGKKLSCFACALLLLLGLGLLSLAFTMLLMESAPPRDPKGRTGSTFSRSSSRSRPSNPFSSLFHFGSDDQTMQPPILHVKEHVWDPEAAENSAAASHSRAPSPSGSKNTGQHQQHEDHDHGDSIQVKLKRVAEEDAVVQNTLLLLQHEGDKAATMPHKTTMKSNTNNKKTAPQSPFITAQQPPFVTVVIPVRAMRVPLALVRELYHVSDTYPIRVVLSVPYPTRESTSETLLKLQQHAVDTRAALANLCKVPMDHIEMMTGTQFLKQDGRMQSIHVPPPSSSSGSSTWERHPDSLLPRIVLVPTPTNLHYPTYARLCNEGSLAATARHTPAVTHILFIAETHMPQTRHFVDLLLLPFLRPEVVVTTPLQKNQNVDDTKTGRRRRRLLPIGAVQCSVVRPDTPGNFTAQSLDAAPDDTNVVIDPELLAQEATSRCPSLNSKNSNSTKFADMIIVDHGITLGVGVKRMNTQLHAIRSSSGLHSWDKRLSIIEERTLLSPYCVLFDAAVFAQVGGFGNIKNGTRDDFSVDKVLNGQLNLSSMLIARDVLRYRILALEHTMESITLNEVHRVGAALRVQVRQSYAIVVDATTMWEEATGKSFDSVSSDFAHTQLDEDEKAETAVSKQYPTLKKLRFNTQRLEEALSAIRMLGRVRDSSTSEEAIGWAIALRMRRHPLHLRSVVSNATAVMYSETLPRSVRQYLWMNKAALTSPSYHIHGVFLTEFANDLEQALPPHFRQKMQQPHGGEDDDTAAIGDSLSSSTNGDGSSAREARDSEHTLRSEASLRSEAYAASHGGAKPFVRVIWNAYCCGCCGFSAEIVHFVLPLEKRRVVNLVPGPTCFCTGYPAHVLDALERLHLAIDQYKVSRKAKNEIVIWVSHTDPMSYQHDAFAKRPADYVIGRSMYEFSRIGQNWVDKAKVADEIWVPGEFIRNMFAISGVPREKLVIIPEGVDTYFFDPESHPKMQLPLEPDKKKWIRWCNRKAPENAYKFYSNFKWEPRKGWDILFTSYFEGFGSPGKRKNGTTTAAPRAPHSYSNANVSLYILTYVFFASGRGDIHNITHVRLELAAFAEAKYGATLESMPHFCLFLEQISSNELAELHNGADAFVLPTRGEGWGLPIIEAMSMGKPVIASDWGGQSEFMTTQNSFIIRLDAVEEVSEDSIYGHQPGKKWATPSINHTTTLMRYVFDNRAHAKTVGQRAREHIVRHYSEEVVADIVDRRLVEIERIVVKQRANG